MPDRRFELRSNDGVVGNLFEIGVDMPWILCSFEPTSSFSHFKPLFDELLTSVDQDDAEKIDKVQNEIESNLRLVCPEDPDMISEFLLHIEGDKVWFRYISLEDSLAS